MGTIKLTAAPEGYEASKNLIQSYQSMIGGLMWPATQSRPDIAFPVGRYLCKPTEDHFQAAKRILCYLKGTHSYSICFTSSDSLSLTGYVDASHADDVDMRRSTGSYVFMLAGGAISYKSGRQLIVTLSSTEAEYVALTLAAKEAIAVNRLLKELHNLHLPKDGPVKIFEDNQPAIDLTKRPASSDGRTKHIELRWHYIRQEINRGNVKVTWIGTNNQAADGLTKALDHIKFKQFRNLIGLVDFLQS
ncbi:Ribonuclease H-like domain [Lasallia pustulata]|uniref:Ribonuclease H-like domain n=1 Tax=Lasallia pustulata TaxID=136370 RepID=A0A1W5CS86_9LECA|nr:Ribonuclease H-like domain [Lasallia pustulata]